MAGWGLPVPEILDADGPRGILLQEDLGDESLQESLHRATAREKEELYRLALDQLVVLQREAARAPQRAGCFQIAFDFEKLSWEMHFFWKHFLEGYRKCDLTVEDRASIADGFHRLCTEISSWPRVLTHRDFHSRNLMAHGGELYWIDFQDARMGPATYDLASLLRDSYVEIDEGFVAERAEEFRQRAVPGDHRDTFTRRFELMSIQRNLKALGTFGYQGTVKQSRCTFPTSRGLWPTPGGTSRVTPSSPACGAPWPAISRSSPRWRRHASRISAGTWGRRCASRVGSTTNARAASSSS